MENHQFPTDQQRRQHTNRSNDNLCSIPLCLGNWKWSRKSSREFSALRICGTLHLPDLYRLSSKPDHRSGHATRTARVPTISTYHHGLVHHTTSHALHPTFGSTVWLHVPMGCLPDHHSISHRVSRLQNLRFLCRHTHHPSSKRLWSKSPSTRTKSRRQRRCRQDSGSTQLVQSFYFGCSLYQSASDTFLEFVCR